MAAFKGEKINEEDKIRCDYDDCFIALFAGCDDEKGKKPNETIKPATETPVVTSTPEVTVTLMTVIIMGMLMICLTIHPHRIQPQVIIMNHRVLQYPLIHLKIQTMEMMDGAGGIRALFFERNHTKKGASLIAPFFHVLQVPAKALQELLLPSWILFPGFKQCKQCIF